MGDSIDVPKKYYRYFLKGLAYYTCHKNRACTLADLQAYVYLKCQEKPSEADLTHLSNEVMEQLVSSGIALDLNGYYRLSECLRVQGTESKPHSGDAELSSGSGLKRMVNFTNTVTMWPIDAAAGIQMASPMPHLEGLVPLERNDVESATAADSNSTESDSEGEEKTNDTKTPFSTPEKEQQSDSDDDSAEKQSEHGSEGDEDEEEFPHKPIKQEPHGESKQPDPEGGDDAQTTE